MAGVTGARSHLPGDLQSFVDRVRAATDKPISVGFGISSRPQVQAVAGIADGVVVGSAVMHAVDGVSKYDKGGAGCLLAGSTPAAPTCLLWSSLRLIVLPREQGVGLMVDVRGLIGSPAVE